MTYGDVLEAVDKIAPFSLAEPWDNAGLLIGGADTAVAKILIALDASAPVIEEAASLGANLIVTHHPVIFSPLRSVTENSAAGRLLRAGIGAICAHTNLDIADGGVNDALAGKLGLLRVKSPPEFPLGRTGELAAPMSPRELAEFAARKLGAPAVKYNDTGKKLRAVALVSGGGADELYRIPAGTDAFITGECKLHTWLDASRLGICLVEAGHFHTENVVVVVLASRLRELLPEAEIVESAIQTDGVRVVTGY